MTIIQIPNVPYNPRTYAHYAINAVPSDTVSYSQPPIGLMTNETGTIVLEMHDGTRVDFGSCAKHLHLPVSFKRVLEESTCDDFVIFF